MTTSTTTAVPLETPDIPEQVLLTFCLRCGEQHRVVNDGVNQCSRCNATETVDNPALVESRFDEVKEQEAIDHLLGESRANKPNADYDCAPPLPRSPTATTSLESSFTRIGKLNDLPGPAPSRVKRLEVLRQHARGLHLRSGWDGSPEELQPMFVQHAYLTTAHNYGDHDDADTPSRDFNSLTTTSTEGEDYGKIVRGLLTSGDFSFGTLHQLLDYTCRDENLLHFGLFDDGYGLAVTSTTHKYADLNYYLLCFLHHHGVPPGFSSIKVESNERGQLKSDPLQAENCPHAQCGQ